MVVQNPEDMLPLFKRKLIKQYEYFERSILYQGTKLWNAQNPNTRNTKDFKITQKRNLNTLYHVKIHMLYYCQ